MRLRISRCINIAHAYDSHERDERQLTNCLTSPRALVYFDCTVVKRLFKTTCTLKSNYYFSCIKHVINNNY